MSGSKITKARITPRPLTFMEPMPAVFVTPEGGEELHLFTFYPDEISFHASEFIGLTVAEAHALKQQKDLRYLQS